MAKILIVDDEINIRNLIVKYAKYENYETLEAGDGMHAVTLCKDEKNGDKDCRNSQNDQMLCAEHGGAPFDSMIIYYCSTFLARMQLFCRAFKSYLKKADLLWYNGCGKNAAQGDLWRSFMR